MDDLLHAMGGGDDTIGLNIVSTTTVGTTNTTSNTPNATGAATATGTGASQSNKRPRKKNKYEKRREKSRLAKAKKLQEQQQDEYKKLVAMMSQSQSQQKAGGKKQNIASSPPPDDDGLVGGGGADGRADGATAEEVRTESAGAGGIVELESAQNNTGIDESNIERRKDNTPVQNDTLQETHAADDDNNNNNNNKSVPVSSTRSNKDTTPLSNEELKTIMEDLPSRSRKNQHSITTQYLQNEEKRAEYMSTYHARPHEMDRKSGAMRHIQPSRESSHIFNTNNDYAIHDTNKDEEEEDNDDDGRGNGNEKEKEKEGYQFTRCGVHPKIVNAMMTSKGCGFYLKQPTLIQESAWSQMIVTKKKRKNTNKNTSVKGGGGGGGDVDGPLYSINRRKNLFVQSETGSGKTLAYFVPILQSLAIDKVTNEPKRIDRNLGGTRVIILCPTRELATQTSIITEKLCQSTFPWLVSGCLSGGEKRKSEKARIRKGVSVLVATPGRLLDHLDKTECLLMALKGKLEWLVLDESDRLLDMGLGSQVEQMIQIIKANQPRSGVKRDGVTWQSVLVSATITEKVEGLSKSLLGGDTWVWARASAKYSSSSNGIISNTGKEDAISATSNRDDDNESGPKERNQPREKELEFSSATPQQLSQHHMVVSAKLRLPALIAFLAARVQKKERVVIFMSTCDGVDFHHKLLSSVDSILPDNINGRENDMEDHKEGNQPGIFGKYCSMYRLHGNVPHRERNVIISQFSKTNKTRKEAAVLIATDVAARGLNLPAVDWIVQYDPPCETSDFIHRSGRAARAGKAGHALLFLLPSESQYVEVLKLRGLKDIPALSLASTLQTAAGLCPDLTSEGKNLSGHGQGATGSRIGEGFASAVQIRLEDCITDDDSAFKAELAKKLVSDGTKDKKKRRREQKEAKRQVGPLLESARKAFNSYIRGYSAKEKAVRHIFSARALHLGHVARSFALKEPPTALTKANRQMNSEEGSEDQILKSTGRKRNSNLAFSSSDKSDSTDRNDKEMERERTTLLTDVEPSSKKKTTHERKKKKKGSVVESVLNTMEDSFYSIKKSEDSQKLSTISNAKAKMFAAANMMQGSGMEFF